MHFDVITVFPEMIQEALKWGVIGKALEKRLFSVNTINPRQFTQDIHKTVDDRPFGGGDGMIMLFEPLAQSCESIPHFATSQKIFLSPAGSVFDDAMAEDLSQEEHIVLLSGRYGGVDQRLIHHYGFKAVSIGDYVLSGGEVPALALIDAVMRKRPQVLGHVDSASQDSFAGGKGLEAPVFTRPRELAAGVVPEVLLCGDHKKIEDYRRCIGQLLTLQNRPDLALHKMTDKEKNRLQTFIREQRREDLLICGLRHSFLEEMIHGH